MSGGPSDARDAATMRVIEELKRIYKTKIMPLESLYRYDLFFTPLMTDAEFDSKPQVMLVGQYSVGKTSFIKYILGRDFPGQRIGPEPTTDRFVAVMDGIDERIIPGNALAVSHDMPYRYVLNLMIEMYCKYLFRNNHLVMQNLSLKDLITL
jgi:EH domain-containing protein 1